MHDPWISTLTLLEPNYSKYETILKEGPKIVVKARKINLLWRVRIDEDWNNSNGELYYTADYSNLDLKCKWAEEQLKNWRFVIRLSHQEWKFFNKRQAEKFVTLFNLRWS